MAYFRKSTDSRHIWYTEVFWIVNDEYVVYLLLQHILWTSVSRFSGQFVWKLFHKNFVKSELSITFHHLWRFGSPGKWNVMWTLKRLRLQHKNISWLCIPIENTIRKLRVSFSRCGRWIEPRISWIFNRFKKIDLVKGRRPYQHERTLRNNWALVTSL